MLVAAATAPDCLLAQSISVPNSNMQMPAPVIHGKPNLPNGWTLEKGKAKNVRAWNSPGSTSVAIGGGAVISHSIPLPELAPKLRTESSWRLVLAVDVTGNFGKKDGASELTAAIRNSETKAVLASNNFSIETAAPISEVAKPSIYASSFKAGGGKTESAFDGNRDTIWHSDYGTNTPKYPHHLTLDFGETKTLKGITYAPRKDGGNGTVKTAAVEVTNDGQKWRRVIDGEFKYPEVGQPQVIKFSKPVQCRAVRLVCLSEIRGAAFASCSELTPDVEGGFDGLAVTEKEEPVTVQRFFLPVDLTDKNWPAAVDIGLTVKSSRYVVVDGVHLMYIPNAATKAMLGKPNGHNGPDLLGAGSYGLEAMMVHQLPALPILQVLPNSPAARAKLKATDLIVGIENKFLPPGNVAPGFEWFESSHEALLGRAAMNSFAGGGSGQLNLKILRGNQVIDVPIRLRLPNEIGNADFLSNPETLELLNQDLIKRVVATQSDKGDWANDPIRTSLGGLALLSTGDAKHARQIKSAANWLMARNAEPGAGWYWHPSFSGIFLCEYYLATGDERALPVIQRMLKMMGSSFHTSKWGTKTFGHGPKGLPYGNKSLVAVMVHVLVFEELAGRCGVDSEIFEILTPYLESAWSNPAEGGHGGMGYNASYKDQGEFWSRSGLFGLALQMRGERDDMRGPLAEIMRERHPWFRNSHAYGEPGGTLGLIGLSQMNNSYFKEVFDQYRWWFALAWEKGQGLHFTIPHMGAPYMESRELINNGYAIVTNIHKSNLQILGGTKRNWLNVAKFPEPISDVMVLQGTDGLVRLQCKIPGPSIHYTLDGSEPNRKSTKFGEPFTVKPGSVVRAIAINKAGQSKIAERGFGYDKSSWKIVSANGDKDPAEAIKRANYAIDGDHMIGWIPDVGEGAIGFPYELVLDMGTEQQVTLAGIRFTFNNGAAAKITVLASKNPTKGFAKIGSQDFDKFTKDARVELKGKEIRYLKFVFENPFQQDGNLLMVGEIDVR